MIEKYKSFYRRYLKNRVRITTATAVAILIGSSLSFGESQDTQDKLQSRALISPIKISGSDKTIVNNEDINPLFMTYGIQILGNRHHVTNNGEISALLTGITSSAEETQIINNGTITAATAISSTGKSTQILNDGTVIGLTGISSSGDDSTITNRGIAISSTMSGSGKGTLNNNGNNVKISNQADLLNEKFGFIIAAGEPNKANIGINSTGNGSEISNRSVIAAIKIDPESEEFKNLMDIENFADLSLADKIAKVNDIINFISGLEGTGIGIKVIGNGNDITNELGGTLLGKIGISSTGNTNTIINSGTIIAKSDNKATGIEVSGNSNIIDNRSTLTATSFTENGSNAAAIKVSGESNTIINSGTTTVKGESGTSIAISGKNNTFKGDGRISVEGENSVGFNVSGEGNEVKLEHFKKTIATSVMGKPLPSITSDQSFSITGESTTGVLLSGKNNILESQGFFKVQGDNSTGFNITGENTLNLNHSILASQRNEGKYTVITTTTDRSFNVSGENAVGVKASGSSIINNSIGSTLNISGKGSTGISLENGALLNNSGLLSVKGEDAVGVKLNGTDSLFNNLGTIDVTGENNRGIYLTQGAIISNSGNINVNGNGVGAVVENSNFTNRGEIHVKDSNGTGILVSAGGSSENRGIITLSKDGAVAMKTEGSNSSAANKGTVVLKYKEGTLTEDEKKETLANIFKSENGEEVEHLGLVKDSKGNIIIVSGDHITAYEGVVEVTPDGYITENLTQLGKYKSLHSDMGITITGTEMSMVLNAATDFADFDGEAYLLTAENNGGDNALNITGVVNGLNNGVSISQNSEIKLNGGVINASKTALLLNENSIFQSNGGEINGNILGTSSSTLIFDNKSLVNGDIVLGNGGNNVTLSNGSYVAKDITFGDGNNTLDIKGGSGIGGNIAFGAGDDIMNVDHESDFLFADDKTISGGLGKNILNIGKSEDILLINGTIENFDIKTDRNIYLGIDAKLTNSFPDTFTGENNGNYKSGNIEISNGNYLVLGLEDIVDKDGHRHALSGISGNSISGDGTFYLDTRNISIDKNGTIVDLEGTAINLDNELIKSTQFIYDVNKLDSSLQRFEGSQLVISTHKNVSSMGIDKRYQDVWTSMLAADQENSIIKTTTDGKASDLENLFFQIKDRNIYSLATRQAYSSMKVYQNGIEGLLSAPELDRWSINAAAVGSYDESEESFKNKIDSTGVVVAGEYGVQKDITLGLAFGAGKQKGTIDGISSELKSDAFYFGAYGKARYSGFNILAGLGYQVNSFKAENNISNRYDNFSNNSDFDSNGFNIYANAGYDMILSNGWTIQPYAGLALNYLSMESADEGNSPMAISISDSKSTITDLKLGVNLSKEYISSFGKSIGTFSLSNTTSFGDLDKNLTGKFNGKSTSDFEIISAEIPQNRSEIGVGITLERENGFSLGASYGYQFGDGLKNNKFTVGAGYKF